MSKNLSASCFKLLLGNIWAVYHSFTLNYTASLSFALRPGRRVVTRNTGLFCSSSPFAVPKYRLQNNNIVPIHSVYTVCAGKQPLECGLGCVGRYVCKCDLGSVEPGSCFRAWRFSWDSSAFMALVFFHKLRECYTEEASASYFCLFILFFTACLGRPIYPTAVAPEGLTGNGNKELGVSRKNLCFRGVP